MKIKCKKCGEIVEGVQDVYVIGDKYGKRIGYRFALPMPINEIYNLYSEGRIGDIGQMIIHSLPSKLYKTNYELMTNILNKILDIVDTRTKAWGF